MMLTATTSNSAGNEVGTLPVFDVTGHTWSAEIICRQRVEGMGSGGEGSTRSAGQKMRQQWKPR
eukprot:scaffold149234_cov33-Tisochrysis_lutea.AAC.4